jgi:hypothetical protein
VSEQVPELAPGPVPVQEQVPVPVQEPVLVQEPGPELA